MDVKQENTSTKSIGQRLAQARRCLHLSQAAVAEAIGASVRSVKRWEQGSTLPQLFYREALCQVLHLENEKLFEIVSDESGSMLFPQPSLLWHIPYQRNPVFTGRASFLQSLHEVLKQKATATALTQPCALNGLGGIGKTQIALEYAYRHATEYTACFWIEAETRETLLVSFISIADMLALPERNTHDQQQIVRAVIHWLDSHSNWLLIFDNVEDLPLLKHFLPSFHLGSLLLTTRLQALGTTAQPLTVEPMNSEEGTSLLLQRAHLLSQGMKDVSLSSADLCAAREIVALVDGLPLALDQAGAYIEETQHSLQDYLRWFRQRRSALLERRGQSDQGHPASVTTTFSLSFQCVEQENPLAADVLRVCAFLAPEALPEEFFTEGAAHLGERLSSIAHDPWLLEEAITILRAYSFLHRDRTTRTLSIHRLVQAVLLDTLSRQEKEQWIKRIIVAMDHVLPADQPLNLSQEQRTLCHKIFSHALACIVWSEQESSASAQVVTLLVKAANYWRDHAQFEEADKLYQRALTTCEQVFGPVHAQTAQTLNDLADLYHLQARYQEAESLLQRALAICEQVHGPWHLDTAQNLNDLALAYGHQRKYAETEPLLQRALAICEHVLGPSHQFTSISLNNLAVLYNHLGKYEKAEPLLLRSLAIREQEFGSLHPRTAISLNDLAVLYTQSGKYEEAESLLQRALAIREREFGPAHPASATSFNDLALVYLKQGRYQEAETLLQRALVIREQKFGSHPLTAATFNNLARLYSQQERYQEAEHEYQQASAILEKLEHPDLAETLQGLGNLYQALGQPEEAAPLLQRALTIREQTLGMDHPKTLEARASLASV